MALIIVSGLPCSGRTTRSLEIASFLRTKLATHANLQRVVHINDDTLSLSRSSYSDQALEKPARAAFLSLVVRSLASDAIVVADGGAGTNIKGFRYQLWCAAREAGGRCCSVMIAAPPDVCEERNRGRRAEMGEESSYDESTMKELLMRYEEPSDMVRWDSPLFVIPSDIDTSVDAGPEPEPAPLEEIWEACTTAKSAKAPLVVAPLRATTTNYLSLLESSTQLLLSAYQTSLTSSQLPPSGGSLILLITLPVPSVPLRLTLNLPAGKRPPTLAALQRIRRSFVKAHSTGAAQTTAVGAMVQREAKAGTLNREEDIVRRFAAWVEEAL